MKHPAFPQPKNTESSIWRYLDLEKFNWLLDSNRLFMPSATRLSDPLEGTQPIGDLDWWRRMATNAESKEKRSIIEHNQKAIDHFANAFRPHYYVSCWHMNEFENKKMWKCYTINSEAIAIRTTYQELKQLLPDYVDIGTVRYIDYANERLPTMNMFEYITHKNIEYSFESEARAVAFPPATEKLGKSHFEGNLFQSEKSPDFHVYTPSIDVSKLIHKVVLHPEATAKFEEKIAELCRKSGLSCPVSSAFSVNNG